MRTRNVRTTAWAGIFVLLAAVGSLIAGGTLRASGATGRAARPSWATGYRPIVLSVYASGLIEPVDIANTGISGDERLFIVEKDGAIRIVHTGGALQAAPFLEIDDRVKSTELERGLLGMAFDPDYATNGFFYVNYTFFDSADPDGPKTGDTRISRFSVLPGDPDKADLNSEIVVLQLDQPEITHNGGNLLFGPDGYLYIPLGDGGGVGDPANRAQDGGTLLGKILRIDVSTVTTQSGYSIPSDNPFVGNGGVLDEIWALGLRNPWRGSFDRATGDLYFGDVGQELWEEIDYQPAASAGGENYGWRCYEGAAAYNTAGCGSAGSYVFPIHTFSHSVGRSVTGGYVYRGTQIPELVGHFFFANFGLFFDNAKLWSLFWDGGAWQLTHWGTYPGRGFTSFGEDVQGELYLADIANGEIYKLYGADLFLPAVFRSPSMQESK